jgi:DNA-binding winged helix-turn-helix (wHTH) protein
MAGREVYEFGEFTLDASERQLSKGSERIPLAPKEHDVLVALLRNAGRLVTKSELLEQVWPGSFVEEGILSVHVSTLRKALGVVGHRFIETVPRSGYRFTAAATQRNGNAEIRRNPEVYELLGRARSSLLSASVFDLPKAIAAFQAAIEADPTYAPAHAGLALAHCAQAGQRLVPPAQAYSDAKAAALRALAMDPACADAQVALAAVLFFSEWNWPAAKKSFERALELDPAHTEARILYGQLLEALGRIEEGLQSKLRALERDPQSAAVHLQISMSYWHQRRYDRAIEWAHKTLALDPRHPHAHEHLAGAYWKMGDLDRYFSENLMHAELHGVPPEVLERLRQMFAAEGRPGMLRRALQRASRDPQAFPAMQLALFHGEAGDMDRAFEHLDRAIQDRDPSLVHLAMAPQWDTLRGDPRFSRCLRRMGLRLAHAP